LGGSLRCTPGGVIDGECETSFPEMFQICFARGGLAAVEKITNPYSPGICVITPSHGLLAFA
jgi:hypothetical protein